MFLVQLAALALHKAEQKDIPEREDEWRTLMRGLTPSYPGDEPWCLVVDEWSKPAFLQAAVPDGVKLRNDVATADGLDLLITSRNHDLKQMIAQNGVAEDWLFALVSLQTCEGYGGAGNQGIVRMNGGSSSRAMLTLAPLATVTTMAVRPGEWFRRDLRVVLETRERVLENTALPYADDGIGLTWLEPWAEGDQLQLKDLDICFIEVCRRVRLLNRNERIMAVKGTSRETRIAAKSAKGSLEDPWAPIHKAENKSLTIGDEGEFDYRTLTQLLFSGEWVLPLLANRASFEGADTPLALVSQALARGNSKTGGFRSRIIPLENRHLIGSWGSPQSQETLQKIAREQIGAIDRFDKALAYSLALAAASGEKERISPDSYAHTISARKALDRFVDAIFFGHLWQRFEVEERDGSAQNTRGLAFARRLWEQTQSIFEQFLPDMPCPSLYRLRAEVRARLALRSKNLRQHYPELFTAQDAEEVTEHA
ncbi:CRISPR-associated protein, Cse1 family [Rhizobium sp. RU36D]|nr:CRISPR-associated protein, Cse1 family [Rhizobium sp. RU36D]